MYLTSRPIIRADLVLSKKWNESYGFIRSSDPSLFPPSQYGSLEDTSSGPGAPDIELMFSPMTYGFNMIIPPGNFMTLTSILLRYVRHPGATHAAQSLTLLHLALPV